MEQSYHAVGVTQEQNELISQLQHSVLQTRECAITIADTLHGHNTMLDDLHQEITETEQESREQNRNILTLLRESESRNFYIIVIVLIALILFFLFT